MTDPSVLSYKSSLLTLSAVTVALSVWSSFFFFLLVGCCTDFLSLPFGQSQWLLMQIASRILFSPLIKQLEKAELGDSDSSFISWFGLFSSRDRDCTTVWQEGAKIPPLPSPCDTPYVAQDFVVHHLPLCLHPSARHSATVTSETFPTEASNPESVCKGYSPPLAGR